MKNKQTEVLQVSELHGQLVAHFKGVKDWDKSNEAYATVTNWPKSLAIAFASPGEYKVSRVDAPGEGVVEVVITTDNLGKYHWKYKEGGYAICNRWAALHNIVEHNLPTYLKVTKIK